MAQVNISLPDGLKSWVDQLVAAGSYSSASDYVRDLIRRDERNAADLAEVQAMIDSGLASGIDPRDPSDIIEAIIAKHRADA